MVELAPTLPTMFFLRWLSVETAKISSEEFIGITTVANPSYGAVPAVLTVHEAPSLVQQEL